LFITVLHKKHPKSFVSNFWGAVQFLEAAPIVKRIKLQIT
jgi:hypothetical protein